MLLLLVISLLTVSAFAWFSSAVRPTTAIEVSVVGRKSVTASYYRDYEDGNGYISALPDSALIDDELFYPGKSAYCRLDVYNRGEEAATVGVSFERVTLSITPSAGAEQDNAEVDALNDVFTLQTFTTPHKGDETFSPDYDTDGTTVKFLAALKETLHSDKTGSIPVVSGVSVPAKSTVSIYYRFHLDDTLSSLSGVFSLRAGAIRISAN